MTASFAPANGFIWLRCSTEKKQGFHPLSPWCRRCDFETDRQTDREKQTHSETPTKHPKQTLTKYRQRHHVSTSKLTERVKINGRRRDIRPWKTIRYTSRERVMTKIDVNPPAPFDGTRSPSRSRSGESTTYMPPRLPPQPSDALWALPLKLAKLRGMLNTFVHTPPSWSVTNSCVNT